RPANQAPVVDLAALPQVFVPAGKVYDAGAPQPGAAVVLQALKPGSLILRGADGSVYFGRQMAKGEAFRVPPIPGLTLDVSNAVDFQVFVYGRSRGVLPAAQVLASKLATPPPAAPAVRAPPPAKAP
ncbi:MAG: helix-turn-helix domain-containing protein, partial [Phenylobacterium sp.]|nr:helix-turn-helix domain-containing protein [Phenylobacterium sp.]